MYTFLLFHKKRFVYPFLKQGRIQGGQDLWTPLLTDSGGGVAHPEISE